MGKNRDTALEKACETYEGYAGMHGLRSYEEVREELGLEDSEDNEEEILEHCHRESWLCYRVEAIEEVKEGEQK